MTGVLGAEPAARPNFRHVLEYDEVNKRVVVYRVRPDIPMHLYTHFELSIFERKSVDEGLQHLGFILLADSPMSHVFDEPEHGK